jgi:YesN/AraC family two-component response regulator
VKHEECKVIIVDDENSVRFYLRKIVEKMGLKVIDEAGDGVDAIQAIKKEQPDLVLLDMNMPRMQGDQTLEIIHKLFPAIKVIMLTSVCDFNTVKECIKSGADNYVLKNNKVEKIKEAIIKVVDEI